MRAVIQRVKYASVLINKSEERKINGGFLVLLGVGVDDTESEASIMAEKIANLRVFSDADDKLNLSLLDVEGEAMVISNFTLYADCSHGRRPSFFESAKPPKANDLYELFVQKLKACGVKEVQTGEFGADMEVSLCNDGPITIIIDSEDIKKRK